MLNEPELIRAPQQPLCDYQAALRVIKFSEAFRLLVGAPLVAGAILAAGHNWEKPSAPEEKPAGAAVIPVLPQQDQT